jgi:hypothetical protein|tara:strand:- start:697 stop:957 length:261 start_codon:yes stop_codon:yes gene_type:complete
MSYGGWGAFFTENGLQVGAVTAATLFGVPFGSSMSMAIANGAVVGLATDAAFNGVRGLDGKRMLNQSMVGAGTAAAVIVVAPLLMR